MTSLLTAAVLVISTTAAEGASTDATGPVLKSVLEQEGGGKWDVVEVKIVSDDVLAIQRAVTAWSDKEESVNAIITAGGTGFSISDVTPEAITPLLHKQATGLVHGMLASSLAVTPFALMARPVAGVRNKSIILTLPGSPKGAKENLLSVLKLLSHACHQASGADSRSLHSGGVKKLEKEAGFGSTSPSQHSHSHDHGHSHGHSHHHGSHGHSHGHAMPVRHTSAESNPQSNDPALGPSRRYRSSPYPMLSVDDALQLIQAHTPPPRIAELKVDVNLVGAVLAEDVTATEAVPAYRASIVDGYAVIANEDGTGVKGTFPVASISHAQAGEIPALKPGEIARITTGAPLPPGATSVVMVEDTVLRSTTEDGEEEKEVEILADGVKPGENVREIGSDIRKGDVILKKGEIISAVGGELGLLVSVGRSKVSVYQRPVIGVLSTGDEIIEHDRPGELKLGEVRDCNRPTIKAALEGWGYETVDLGIVTDKPGALEETLRSGLRQVDMIITSGGVSMGELDLLKPTVERSLGGTIHFGRVSMKPGKPTTFATVPVKDNSGERLNKVIFSLPGNPVSAVVTLNLFVLPSLHVASGRATSGLAKVLVTLEHDVQLDPQRPEYHRAIVTLKKDGLLYATSTGGQRSSRIGSMKSANALLCLPAGKGKIAARTTNEALLMENVHSDLNYV